MRQIEIDREEYSITNPHEFKSIQHPIYSNLKIYTDVPRLEKLIGFLRALKRDLNASILKLDSTTRAKFGGYLERQYNKHLDSYGSGCHVLFSLEKVKSFAPVDILIIPNLLGSSPSFQVFEWPMVQMFVYVKREILSEFSQYFQSAIVVEPHGHFFKFNNLLHLVMIVKNAGPGFKKILEANLPFIDRWTILDTGSTDSTVETIREVLGKSTIPGELFEEPFVDFGTTRNRALELAGDWCKYTVMLDDTYVLEGNLREFLEEVRGDQFSDSFSLYITSNDLQYASNRILKSQRRLQYMFKIHEVIQDKNNKNVIIPLEVARIEDKITPYMEERTANRKAADLQLLFQSIREDLDNPRHLYYVAQTYVGMKNYEMAYRYYLERLNHHQDGFLQEKIDACFEAARIGQYQLKRPWSEVYPLYRRAYEMDKTRPDAIYFLAMYEMLETKNRKKCFDLLKKAYKIGYPVHAQYSLKPTLSFHFVPKFLVNSLCYEFEDYPLGAEAAELYLKNNPPDTVISSWLEIYRKFLQYSATVASEVKLFAKPIVCFVADGNWTPWNGNTLESEKGLGGSETCIAEIARGLQGLGQYQVIVFCRCEKEITDRGGVQYKDLSNLYSFLKSTVVQNLIVSRFTEYLPVVCKSDSVENVYLILHDLTVEGTIIIRHPKIRKIFLLSPWHKNYFDKMFPILDDLTEVLPYGIHPNYLAPADSAPRKKKSRFIYSSFANRGLLPLLQMWEHIRAMCPEATLDIFCDIHHTWVKTHFPDLVKKLEHLLKQPGIFYHGWVSKTVLAEAWKRADIWLYPCVFAETFCLTALEAASSKTLVITNDLAALQTTADPNRCLIVPGDASTMGWSAAVLSILKHRAFEPGQATLLDTYITRNYDWAKFESWGSKSRLLGEKYFIHHTLEYRGRLDWTMDEHAQTLVLRILQDHTANTKSYLNILDVFSWTGTSLVEVLRHFPHACGVAIDPWEKSDIHQSYLKNIMDLGTQRIRNYFKSSNYVQTLLDLVTERELFQVIFFHVPKDMILSPVVLDLCCRLLSQHGIVIFENVGDNIIWESNPFASHVLIREKKMKYIHPFDPKKSLFFIRKLQLV